MVLLSSRWMTLTCLLVPIVKRTARILLAVRSMLLRRGCKTLLFSRRWICRPLGRRVPLLIRRVECRFPTRFVRILIRPRSRSPLFVRVMRVKSRILFAVVMIRRFRTLVRTRGIKLMVLLSRRMIRRKLPRIR